MLGPLKTPILFLIFNRPEQTQRVFDVIRRTKPLEIYIAADGPRDNHITDREKCEETRRIINQIDWKCKIKTLFRNKNIGCGKAVSSAISWFFENVGEGIILEDDCLPDESFFYFCQELLEYFRSNEKIFMISGVNFLPNYLQTKQSYYFSQIPHIWGWATWRRSWKKYDFKMQDLPMFLKNEEIRKIWNNKNVQESWSDILRDVYSGVIDTWDYQWTYAMWKSNAFSISPMINLVSNIGHGEEATHTINTNSTGTNMIKGNMVFPLLHPQFAIYTDADTYENQHLCSKKYLLMRLLKTTRLFKPAQYVSRWAKRKWKMLFK